MTAVPSGLGAANSILSPPLAGGSGAGRQVRRVLRAHHGQGGRQAVADAGHGYLAEQHRSAGGGIAERGHLERVLGRKKRRERGQEAGIYLHSPAAARRLVR